MRSACADDRLGRDHLLGGHDHRVGGPRVLDVHVRGSLELGVAGRVDRLDVDQRHVGDERRHRHEQLVGERTADVLRRRALEQVGAQQRGGGQERHAHRAGHQPHPERQVAPLLVDRRVALDVLAEHLGDPPAQPDPHPARDQLARGAGGQEQLGLVAHQVARQGQIAPLRPAAARAASPTACASSSSRRPRRCRRRCTSAAASASDIRLSAAVRHRGRPTRRSATSGITSAAKRSTCSCS